MTPLLVLVLAALRAWRRLTARKVAGMAMALAGVVLLKAFEVKHPGGGGPTWRATCCTFAGCCAFALFTVFGKPATKQSQHASR